MTRLEWLTYDHFADRVGESFDVMIGDGPAAAMELVDATESTEPGGRGPDGQERRQFSLVFRGPAGLPQSTYQLSHADLGDLDLFLVPVGQDGDGMRYEAAFA